MAKPGTIPTLSTSEANQDTPSGGQIASGWTVGQTGVSDYDNWFKNWTGKWLTYLDNANPETRTINLPISFPANATPISDVGVTTGTVWSIGIPIEGGKTITAVRCRVMDNVTGPTRIRVTLIEVASGVGTPIANVATTGTAGTVQSISLTGLTTAVVSGDLKSYELKFDLSTGAAICHIYSVEVDFIAS